MIRRAMKTIKDRLERLEQQVDPERQPNMCAITQDGVRLAHFWDSGWVEWPGEFPERCKLYLGFDPREV